jgi:hypothetical protein
MGTKKVQTKTEEAKDKFRNVIGLNYVDHKLETKTVFRYFPTPSGFMFLFGHKGNQPDNGKLLTLNYEF